MDWARVKIIARGVALGFAGLVLLCLVAVGVALLWLRTPGAARTLYDYAAQSLQKQGVYLSVGDISGPLPFALHLGGLQVADASGPWLDVESLRVELRPFELLHGSLTVDRLYVTRPKLLRVPDLPSAGEGAGSSTGSFPPQINLPVRVGLDDVRIIQATLQPGALDAVAPEQKDLLARFEGLGLNARLAAALEHGVFARNVLHTSAQISLGPEENADPATGLVALRLSDLTLELGSTLKGSGGLELKIGDESIWQKLGLSTDVEGQSVPLWGAATLELQGSGQLDADKLVFDAKGALQAESRHHYFSATGLGARFNLRGTLQNMLAQFSAIGVEGMGLALQGQGELNLRNLAARLESTVQIQGKGPWYTVISRLADTQAIPTGNFKGRLGASLTPAVAEAQSIDVSALGLHVEFDMLAEGLDWRTAALDEALGAYAAVQGDFSGPLLSPYRANIKLARTGKSPQSGAAPFTAKGSGWYELALPGVAPPNPDPRYAAAEQQKHLTMYAAVDGVLPDFAAFLPPKSGFGGPVEGHGEMFGLIKDVGSFFDFSAQGVNLGGTALDTPLEQVTALQAKAEAKLKLGNGLDMRGLVEAKGALPKSGAVNWNSGWFLSQPPQKPLVIGLDNIKAVAAGAYLGGQVQATLTDAQQRTVAAPAAEPFAGASSLPAFDGALFLRVSDWHNVNALLGRLEAPFFITRAEAGDVSLSITSAPGKEEGSFSQNAVLALLLPEVALAVPEAGQEASDPGSTAVAAGQAAADVAPASGAGQGNSGYIRNIQGRVDLANLYGVPVLNAHLRADSGHLGPADWQSAAAYLDFSDKTGRINFAMRADENAIFYVQKVDDAMPAFTPARKGRGEERVRVRLDEAQKALPPAESHIRPEELLVLQGSFNLAPFEAVVQRLVLHAPARSAGVFSRGPAHIYWGEELSLKNLRVGMLSGGEADCEASFGAGKANLALSLRDVPLSTARIFGDYPLPEGKVNAEAKLRTTQGKMDGDISMQALLDPPRSESDNTRNSGPMLLALQGKLEEAPGKAFARIAQGGARPGVVRLHGEGTLAPQGGSPKGESDLRLEFDMPFAFNGRGLPGLHYTAPLGARATWHGNVRNVWRLLPLPDRELAGLAHCNAELGGSLAALTYSGEAYLAQGRYEDKVAGLLVTDINAELKSTPDGARLVLAAQDGLKGHAAFEASLAKAAVVRTGLGGDKAEPSRLLNTATVSARGQINHFAPLRRDDFYARVSGLVDADGSLAEPNIKMNLTVERSDLNILSTLGGSVSTLPVESRKAPLARSAPQGGPQLDIKVDIPNRLFIRGMGLESEWQGEIAVNGPLRAPLLKGKVSPVRGYLDLLSRPFALGKGEVSFWGGQGFDSSIALQLTYSSSSLVAYINASGSAQKPKLVLTSVPPMPQDQIMSQVLFGKDVRQLSAVEALQVANGVRELVNFGSGTGGFDLLTGMRRFLGVDTLRIGSTDDAMQNQKISGSPGADAFGVGNGANADDTASPTVEAGKYINDAIYIGVEQGAVEDSTRVRVEVELRPNLTLQGSSSVKSSDVGIGWKRDY